ncbi:TPA: ATP-dependent DNA helicase RecQ [Escherichia coli]|uniref:DEAD/DEAH box helicase n=1 Tax=Enterobacteriaceae TaxID=543 RepID=UPI00084BC563|nr:MULTISPECIES: DEAD/DEAH box helicase [Enterobacteriaceae]AYU97211.1 ATP-dependent DNA helicase RecQ [Enterobacter cloacae]MDU6686707.1 DEAD/DEAH box helicase [Enterobacteriaceae bacterium]AOP85258.1 DEAD/DEAH box helicase [Enterobacter kobei]EEW1969409.1 ATP-dependent DNA helicase RecQ [Escherichia coli]EEW2311839.1 ATP-dependent DNA helicase RecQ [Escherichia coli]
MPTRLNRLLALAADAEPLNTAPADAQQLVADKIVVSRNKQCPVKRKPIQAAFNTESQEFYFNADDSVMSFREWKEANGIGRKTHARRADAGLRQIIQPGDAIHCRRAELVMWLNKKPARYAEPLPPDFPGVRVDDAALKPREHAIPEATTGQNAFLKACREFLICDEKTIRRINRGMSKLEAMRHADFDTLGDSPEFHQLWGSELKSTKDNFNTKNQHCDVGGADLPPSIPPLVTAPYRFRELEQCDRPAFVPLPPPDGGDWRPGQQDVAAAVFARDRDMLAVLPTGYGKTAAFTYALQFESGTGDGLTVIVVPTNTIKQQVLQQLRETGVHAVAFGDKLPKRRNAQQLAGLAAGAFRVVVVSPEHLVPGSQVLAALMAAGVDRFIIDEVHTVDDWEFRAAFPAMKHTLQNAFPDAQRCAFTATLRRGDEFELMKELGCRGEFLTFRASAARENIQLVPVRQCEAQRRAAVGLVDALPVDEKTLVMVDSIKMLYAYLDELGSRARPYHSDTRRLSRDQRHANAEWFATTPGAVLIATKAFGLGADIPDVHNVIITYTPEDLPDLVQMVGRAGRDGQPARAFLLWSSLALGAAPDELAALYRPENCNWGYISRFL